jgi:hypothetical protein
MDDSLFDPNMLPEPTEHLRDEQSCPEQQAVDGVFATYQLTPNERRLLLLDTVSSITGGIIREHMARVQSEVAMLETWWSLPEPEGVE